MGDVAEPEPLLLAVDFTADMLRLVLAEPDGTVIEQQEHTLPALPDETLWAWEVGGRIASAFAGEGNRRWALGIAVACPGNVDPIAGVIEESAGQPEWDGLHVVDAIRRHIDAPVVALNRARAALRGEASAGVASGVMDALFVSLDGIPQAAILSNGRILDGARHGAGNIPAIPEIAPGATPSPEEIEQIASVIADATALLDVSVVIIEAGDAHAAAILPVVQGVLDELIPGVTVTRPALGRDAAVLGALRHAEIVAYEGEREA